MPISPHVQRIRDNEDNVKRGHKYYRNKENGYGRSIFLSSGTSRSTKAGDFYQPDTREFQGTRAITTEEWLALGNEVTKIKSRTRR